jgi:hypothetical protein
MEYSKINQNDPKLRIYHVLTVARQHKKTGIENQKKINSLPTAISGSWQRAFADCQGGWQSAKPATLPTADGVAVGKGDGVDGVNHGLPLPTVILCQLPGSRQSHSFANCLAVGKARQSANPALPTAGNSSWQRDLFAECRKKTVGKENCSRQRASFL